jgi:DNA-directed RNA polymerase subunit RPC12/RpoP
VERQFQKMYECSACTSVFIVIQYRRPESMPSLREPLHCPYCMSRDNSLTRIHAVFPDRKQKSKAEVTRRA